MASRGSFNNSSGRSPASSAPHPCWSHFLRIQIFFLAIEDLRADMFANLTETIQEASNRESERTVGVDEGWMVGKRGGDEMIEKGLWRAGESWE